MKDKICSHFDGGVCCADWDGEVYGEGCELTYKDTCPHQNLISKEEYNKIMIEQYGKEYING